MTFFKSVLDASDATLDVGQILVKNTSGRPFRVSTVGVLTPTGGLAVVDATDPIVVHNLHNKRITEVKASKSTTKPAEETKPAASKKSKKKKQSEEAQSEEPASDESSEEVTEEVTEEVIVEPETTEEESAPVETADAVEELKVTPDMANDSL